ncbi:hypothetical protein ANCDUO_19636, partial [Ancylostoma duodenale]
ARRVAKQATDGLSELQQSSSKEIMKWKQELKEANKNLDMLRFERDSLQNHSDQRDQRLEQMEARLHDFATDLKAKEDALIAAKAEVATRDQEIRQLKDRIKQVETVAEAQVKRREMEITKQMDQYLAETKAIDAERERLAKAKVMEVRKQLKLVEEQRDEAERRAHAAEAKVADYEENFIQYRGQMEGEALRAITNGYRNALSAIPSSRPASSPLDRLFPLARPRSPGYGENI